MNNESGTLVIIEESHPLYNEISSHYETRNPKDALASFETYELIIDLSIMRTKKKILFLKELARTTKSEIISDLTLAWGEMVLDRCPQVTGAVSLLFFSPTKNVEYFARNLKSKTQIENFLASINRNGIKHQELKVGFHYPRVISMIINEAHFALDEKLATSKAIDLAMKYGVNYPLGPIEWGEKIGHNFIIELLNELQEITQDSRYRLSMNLKMKGKYI